MPGGRGAGLLGEMNSFSRSRKLPKFPPQSTSNPLLIGAFEAGGADRKNLRFSLSPEPNDDFVNGTSLRSVILTGRSTRNCLRLDQKSFGIICAGLSKSGSASRDTGITSSGPVRFGRLNSSGSKFNGPGTVSLYLILRRGSPADGSFNR